MIRILIADPDSATRKALTLLLDWRLYGSPAPETCRLLQRAYPKLKIVVLSVDSGDAATKEAGADFIHKGAPLDELIATLMPLLRKDI